MKKLILCLFPFVFSKPTHAQQTYWQQQVNFAIHVSLNDSNHSLNGDETIEYINNSTDTLPFIWFHLWANAYRDNNTAFSRQLLKERRTDFYFSTPGERGYISNLDFKVDGSPAKVVTDSVNDDIIQLQLPQPLLPHHHCIITTPFYVKLPYNFSRGGHVGNDYQVTQWYPKPAVYDQEGWHPMPYLDQGEFYSEFGRYNVTITLPAAYIVAATGVLQNVEKLQPVKENRKLADTGSTKQWHFIQDRVHDFAWFASKEFIVQRDTALLPSKKIIDIFSYYKPGSKGWKESTGYAKNGIHQYSGWVGDYPYTTVSVVQGSNNQNSGGMEYPTITLITSQQTGQDLDATIVHEIGHNWFYGALASNERMHPWMDEGMNTYYQKRYEAEKYPEYSHLKGTPFAKKRPADEEGMLLATMEKIKKDQPIETTSTAFTTINYELIAYYKTTQWMKKLEDELGQLAFDSSMKNYFQQWKFKHPTPLDFKQSIEKSSDKNLESIFKLLVTTGSITQPSSKTIQPSFLFNLNDQHHYINFAPVIGFNKYDNLMPGLLLHNYTLPLPNLQFHAGILYGTGSNKWNGFVRTSFNQYKRNYHLSYSLGYISYSQNHFINPDKTAVIPTFKRWVPSVKLTLFNKDPLSTRRITGQWKTFFLYDDSLHIQNISSPAGTIHSAAVDKNYFYINRLNFSLSDNRELHSYNITFDADQGKEFLKAGLTASYFINYKRVGNGLNVRFFAGKFFYLTAPTNATINGNARYFLTMSGPSGFNDYTHSDYFIGRNETTGALTHQLMERDGFFKVSNGVLPNRSGIADNWLMSANLVSDFPQSIDPFKNSLFQIPLKLFADFGTYATVINSAKSQHFLYDAGIQIPLLSSLVNIYIPIFYSGVYKNYYKSITNEKRLLKSVTFTINLHKFKLQELFKDVPL